MPSSAKAVPSESDSRAGTDLDGALVAPLPVVQLSQITKSYNIGEPSEVEVLHGIDLLLREREFVALMGPSGSGKSTLLNMIGLLDRPTTGSLSIDGHDTRDLDDTALTRLRSATIGFVFQHHLLLSHSP